jgi:hypothetical protein
MGTEDVPRGDGAIPEDAWQAANHAFDSAEWSAEFDELYQALTAASPHIRRDELDQLIRMLDVRLAQTPVLGWLSGVRRALEDIRAELIQRRDRLKGSSPP